MKFWLHPEAREDLREAAEYYRDNVGTAFSQLLLVEFERSVNLLLEHPRLGGKWRYGKRRFVIRHFPFGLIYNVVDDQLLSHTLIKPHVLA